MPTLTMFQTPEEVVRTFSEVKLQGIISLPSITIRWFLIPEINRTLADWCSTPICPQ
jgi:hypothetical protein